MRVLPTHLIRRIKEFDRSLDVLWNGRINRWVVVQWLPKPGPVTDELLGCAAITQDRSNYKFLMTCELEQHRLKNDPERGVPIEPGEWIIPYIRQRFPTKKEKIQPDAPFGDPYRRARWARQEAEDREKRRVHGDRAASMKVDHERYVKANRKHFDFVGA